MRFFFIRQRLLPPVKNFVPLIFLTGGIFLFDGCGKKQSSTNASSPNKNLPPEPVVAAGNTPRVAPVMVADSADVSAQLAQLTQVLRRYAAEQRRVPQSLNEVKAAGYLAALPMAPPAKQFVIDGKSMQVVLAKQ